jgi:hypothetical protein
VRPRLAREAAAIEFTKPFYLMQPPKHELWYFAIGVRDRLASMLKSWLPGEDSNVPATGTASASRSAPAMHWARYPLVAERPTVRFR